MAHWSRCAAVVFGSWARLRTRLSLSHGTAGPLPLSWPSPFITLESTPALCCAVPRSHSSGSDSHLTSDPSSAGISGISGQLSAGAGGSGAACTSSLGHHHPYHHHQPHHSGSGSGIPAGRLGSGSGSGLLLPPLPPPLQLQQQQHRRRKSKSRSRGEDLVGARGGRGWMEMGGVGLLLWVGGRRGTGERSLVGDGWEAAEPEYRRISVGGVGLGGARVQWTGRAV